MTAQELDKYVSTLRKHDMKVDTRCQVVGMLWNISYALESIGRKDLAHEIDKLSWEIDDVDHDGLLKTGTFQRRKC